MSEEDQQISFNEPTLEELAELFPGYEIEGLIASGGMGAVYCALQRSLDRQVAIKLLPSELSGDDTFRTRFEAEAKAMAKLNHPNLIGVYDFGEAGGMLYIIMEYVPGQSLFHSSNGTAIDAGEVVRIVSAVCDGLSHAHQHRIIHRDIKPANILLDLKANPKVGDFGLARPVEHKDQEGDEIFGTPGYTAPEVVNDPLGVDHRADIFSIGVMLHELLTSKLPDADPRTASAIIHCDPRYDAVIHKATAPNRDHRYADAAEIAAELRKIASSAGPKLLQTAASTGTTARRPIGKKGARKFVAKQKSSASPIIFLLLCGAAVAGFMWYQRIENNKRVKSDNQEKIALEAEARKAAEESRAEAERVKREAQERANAMGEQARLQREAAAKAAALAAQNHQQQQQTEADANAETQNAQANAEELPEPKFDVDGFLQKAKTVMKQRTGVAMTTYQSDLDKNLKSYDRDMRRAIRKAYYKRYQEIAGELQENAMKELGEDNKRIPMNVADISSYAPAATLVHSDYLNKQEDIDKKLRAALVKEAPTYVLGIQKQIERLSDDPGAEALLKEEIQKVQSDNDYFPDLMTDGKLPVGASE